MQSKGHRQSTGERFEGKSAHSKLETVRGACRLPRDSTARFGLPERSFVGGQLQLYLISIVSIVSFLPQTIGSPQSVLPAIDAFSSLVQYNANFIIFLQHFFEERLDVRLVLLFSSQFSRSPSMMEVPGLRGLRSLIKTQKLLIFFYILLLFYQGNSDGNSRLEHFAYHLSLVFYLQSME